MTDFFIKRELIRNGNYRFALYDRDTSEASCGENRPNYKFVRYLEFDEAMNMVLNGEAGTMNSITEQIVRDYFEKLPKPRIRVKAISRKVP